MLGFDEIMAAVHDNQEKVMTMVRREYTVMPRFGFHQPLDYLDLTLPYEFQPATSRCYLDLPIPTGRDCYGYSPDEPDEYITWGKHDHDLIVKAIRDYGNTSSGSVKILDFGCSSGRVLRHFLAEYKQNEWQLFGCDIQAHAIEWMRTHFPQCFQITTSSVLPHLPFEDNSFDCIYGFSVFTHIKYLWDAWLLELKRVLKPGGLLIQTIHAEAAWRHYYENREQGWVKNGYHTPRVYNVPQMDVNYLYYGDISVSQVFWKKDIARQFWGRYFDILDILPPPEHSFQDWIICRKSSS